MTLCCLTKDYQVHKYLRQRLKGMVHPKMKIVIYIHPHFKYNGLESCLVLKVLQHSFFCVVQSKRNVYRFEKT